MSNNKIGQRKDILPEDLLKLMQSGEAILYDVRAGEQYNQEHIEGAVANAANAELNIDWPHAEAAAGKIVCVHCNGGGRSGRVANKYANDGEVIYNLIGGIKGWKMANQNTIKG